MKEELFMGIPYDMMLFIHKTIRHKGKLYTLDHREIYHHYEDGNIILDGTNDVQEPCTIAWLQRCDEVERAFRVFKGDRNE